MDYRLITGVSGFLKEMKDFLASLIFSYIPIEKRCGYGVHLPMCVSASPYVEFEICDKLIKGPVWIEL